MTEESGRVQRARWYMPRGVTEPIRIEMNLSPLELVVVTRSSLPSLSPEWDTPGAYLLLDPPDATDTVGVYVGKATTLRLRVQQHVAGKPSWRRALMIRNKSVSFHNAEAAWLEGRLHLALTGAARVTLRNVTTPGDETLSEDDRDELESIVPPVLAVLRVLGLDPDTRIEPITEVARLPEVQPQVMPRPSPSSAPTTGSRAVAPAEARTRSVYPETLQDLVQGGLLPPGAILVHDNHSGSRATVTADGLLDVNGRQYDHPSPAAVQLSGNLSENGWRWWSLRSPSGRLVPLKDLREQLHSRRGPGLAAVHVESEPAQPEADGAALPGPDPQLVAMVASGVLVAGQHVVPMSTKRSQVPAVVEPDGYVRIGQIRYPSLDDAAAAVLGHLAYGWTFWCVERGGRRVSLGVLRDGGIEADGTSAPSPPALRERARPRRRPDQINWPSASVEDLLDVGRLTVGQRLRGRYKGRKYEAVVRHDGTLQVGQKTYASMTSAAEAIADSKRNGWQFWSLEDGRPVSDLRRAPRNGT